MRRKDLTDAVLKIIGGEPTGYNMIYCDRSQSLNLEKRKNLFFMRFKYPCFSQKVKINFYEYKERIQKYLKSIGENHATVHLRKTKSYYRRDYYYIIEIIFHNGKPWEKKEELDYEFSSHPSMKKKVQSKGKVSKSAVNKTTVSISQVGITIKSDLKENEVVIDKQKLANLIKLDIETNPTLYTRSCHMTNDKLIELYKLVYL